MVFVGLLPCSHVATSVQSDITYVCTLAAGRSAQQPVILFQASGQYGFAAASDFVSYMQCAPGTQENSANVLICDPCDVATYSSIAGTVCVVCPLGSINNSTGLSACHNCELGSYALDNECKLCAPGTFTAAASSIRCSNCPLNTFSVMAGSTSCLACPIYSQAAAAQSQCSCLTGDTYVSHI